MLLPPANRSMLKLLLDLLYHTARNQHTNKMSAINLATMFAPHIIWPKNVGVLWSWYCRSLKILLTVMGYLKGDAVYYVGDSSLKTCQIDTGLITTPYRAMLRKTCWRKHQVSLFHHLLPLFATLFSVNYTYKYAIIFQKWIVLIIIVLFLSFVTGNGQRSPE